MATLLLAGGLGGGLLSTISTVAAIAGPVLAIAGAAQGRQEAQAQSAEFGRQATEERLMASVESERMRRAARQRQSIERTSMIEGGALSGTAVGVLDQNAVAQELDALTVEFQGEQRGRAADFQASQQPTGALPIFTAAIKGFNQFDPLNLGN